MNLAACNRQARQHNSCAFEKSSIPDKDPRSGFHLHYIYCFIHIDMWHYWGIFA